MIGKNKRSGLWWALGAAGALLMMLILMGGCAPSAPPLLPDDAEYFGTSYSLELVRAVGRRWGERGLGLSSATDFAVDQDGNVVSIWWRLLTKFDPGGEWMWQVKLGEDFPDEVGLGPVGLGLEPCITLDASGNIYIADSVAHRIVKYTPAGDLEWARGQLGEEPGEFKAPTGIAIDQAGSLYIADAGNRRVQKLDSDGDFIWEITSPEGYPSWLAVDEKDHLYVLDHRLWFDEDGTWAYSMPWSLLVFDTEGNLLHRLPVSKTFEDASWWETPRVSLDRHRGHLYLISGDQYQESFSIRAIDPMSGQLLMNISRPVLEDYQGGHVPEGIYVDGPRYLYYTLASDLLQYRIVDAFVEARDKYLRYDYQTAASLLSEIASIGPSNPNALYYLGHSLEQLNQPDQAIVYYRMAAQLAPHKPAGQMASTALARLHPAPPAKDPPNPPLIVSVVVLSLIAVLSRMVSHRQTGSIWEAVYRFGATFRTVTLLVCLTVLPLILLVHGVLSVGGPLAFASQRLSQLEPWYLRFGWKGVVVALLPELILYGLPGLVALAYGLSAWATQMGGDMRPWSEDDVFYEEMLSCLRMAASRLGLSASNITVYTPRDPDEAHPGWRKAADKLVRLAIGTTVARWFEPFVFGRRVRDARLFVPQCLFQGGYLSRAEIEQVMIHELSHIAHGDVALQSWTRSLKLMIRRWFLILSGAVILRTLIQTYLLFPFELWSLFAEQSDASVPSLEYTQFVIRWVLTNQVAGAVIFLLWLVPFYLLLNALTAHTLRERELAADIRAIGSSSDVAALKSALKKIGLLERLHPPDKHLAGWWGQIGQIYVALLERARRLGKSFNPHPDVGQRLAVVSATLEGEVRPLPSLSSVFFSCVASWFLSASLYGLLAIFPGSATPQSKQLSLGLLNFEIVPDQRWLWMVFGTGLVAVAWANLTGLVRLRRVDPGRDIPWFGLLIRLLLADTVYAFLWGVVPWTLSQDVYAVLSGFVPAQVDLYDLGRFVARSSFLRQALPGLSILMGRIYSPLTTLSFIINLWTLPFIYAFLALALMATIWLGLPRKLLVPKGPAARLRLCAGLVGVVVILSGARDSWLHTTWAPGSNDTYVLDMRIQTQETVPGRSTWINDIQVDSQGNIYAAGDDQVYLFDSKGRSSGHIDLQPYLGESAGGRVIMALDRDGQLLAHQYLLSSLKWFNPEGQLIADIPFPAGRLYHNRAVYEHPSIIHLDRRDNLSVSYGSAVVKYTRTDRFTLEFDPDRLYDYERYTFLAFGPAGEMYFLDTEDQVIVQFDQFARLRLRFEGVVYGADDPESRFQASVDPHGNLYLTNTRADRVQMFNSQGRRVMDFELVNSSTSDRLDLVYGVRADSRGNLYTIGPNDREVLRFRLVKNWAVPADAEIVSRRLPSFHSSALFCSSSPPGAEVLLNGEEMGRTPLLIWNLVPGEHHVLLRSEAWSYFKAINLTDGAITHLDVDLAPDINTLTPSLASRYVPIPDSSEWTEWFGETELPKWRVTELALPKGTEVEEDVLKAGILIDEQGRAYAISGDRAAHSDMLTNEPIPLPSRDSQGAILLISSIPEGATVNLNDVEIGRTPLLVGDLPILPIESYTVFVRSDTWGYHNSIIDTEHEDFNYIEAKLR
jgi:Zn-dependent protease with chaperone function/sugar lactone lactonase YvrE